MSKRKTEDQINAEITALVTLKPKVREQLNDRLETLAVAGRLE